jgi:uncharacterized membrane protein
LKPAEYFTTEEQSKIVAAIAEAENHTSGEIRVHIEKKCVGDPVQRAIRVFAELKMHETAERNGILFYLAIDTHAFALVGDEGIHKKVGQEFWEIVRNKSLDEFKHHRMAQGLIHGILECGQQLKKYFPHGGASDKNELHDDISFK